MPAETAWLCDRLDEGRTEIPPIGAGSVCAFRTGLCLFQFADKYPFLQNHLLQFAG
jgi:hypothetical protein